MTCSHCGFVLSVLDKACPRCSSAVLTTPQAVELQSPDWEQGDRIFARWVLEEAFWYPGTITKVNDTLCYVVFDDGDEQWTHPGDIMSENLRAGSRVYTNWKHLGRYYPGVIESRPTISSPSLTTMAIAKPRPFRELELSASR